MIVDLPGFINEARPRWQELERMLDRLRRDASYRMDLDELQRFHFLYQHTAADLGRIKTFASEPETRRYLEQLVAQAYAEIHETRRHPHRFTPLHWLWVTFPNTFRRRILAFWLALAAMLVGVGFGALALAFDPDAKAELIPGAFGHLYESPEERVAGEEEADEDPMEGNKQTFAAMLMTHNIRVSIFSLSLGLTWGLGTFVLLFYNGIILGVVGADYILADQARFLFGWLLPHGAVELPAIIVGSQAGLVLAGAMIGWRRRISLRHRLREVTPDVVTLAGGLALMLIWAGIIEAFLSQYHEPFIPYEAKILFGVVELVLLTLYLGLAGRAAARREAGNHA